MHKKKKITIASIILALLLFVGIGITMNLNNSKEEKIAKAKVEEKKKADKEAKDTADKKKEEKIADTKKEEEKKDSEVNKKEEQPITNNPNNNNQTEEPTHGSCKPNNPDGYYYTDANGELQHCPGYNDPPPPPPKPTYVCEFAYFDKNMPCDWIPPNQVDYDYGPFKDFKELFADAENRGYEGPQILIQDIYSNRKSQFVVYKVLY